MLGITKNEEVIDFLQKELHRTQFSLEKAISLGKIGIWDWDIKSDKVNWYGEMYNIFGVPPEKFSGKGKDYLNFLPKSDLTEQYCHSADQIESDKSKIYSENAIIPISQGTTEFRIKQLNGSTIWVRGMHFAEFNTEARPFRLVGFITDITQEKKIESELLHSQKMETLGNILSSITHEFKNTLATIKGYTELSIDEKDLEQIKQNLSTIERQVNYSQEITNQLLHYSKKDQSEISILNPKESVIEFVKLYKILEPNITINLQIDDNLGLVKANKNQLIQIGSNLITNAIQAIGNKNNGLIMIQAKSKNCQTCTSKRNLRCNTYNTCFNLSVEDNGTGISIADLSRVFTPFFTTKPNGTGLGLSIIQKIVDNFNGIIFVDSIEGKGANFGICIPYL